MPGQEGLSPVEKLNATHDVDSFLNGAYALAEDDVRELLNGTNPLGSDVL